MFMQDAGMFFLLQLLKDFLLLSGQHGIDLSSEGEDFVDPTPAFC